MIPPTTKVYFAVKPADLRRSFFGLAALANAELERNPAEGGLFVFCNRRRDQIRVLFKDPHGWCLVCKRLDRGHFRRPSCEEGRFVWEADATALLRFLEDIEWRAASRGRSRRSIPRLTLLQPELSLDQA